MAIRPVLSGGRMIYCFANCVLDTHRYTLQWADQRTRLAPKVFGVLCYLIEHRDRVVSKQELCEQVWAGSAITEATLESCLRGVRLAVGDSGQAQHVIQTQRGYGYRFVADVALLPDATSTPPLPPETAPALTPPPVSPGVRPCAACQYANHEDATFCVACGMRLRQPCAHCGRDILLPAAFCTACGQSLVAPAPELSQTVVTPSAPQGFGAERKLITVLCCTVVSTAAGGTSFDLDILYSVMQELHDLAHDVVRPYGGRLSPTIGDRLLILFGAPAAYEDDARRAVRVAFELHRRLQVHQERLERVCRAPLAFRIGLHTGLVVVGGGWDDTELSTVVGDVVSVAMVLQEQAAPGQILCSDTTARLVRGMARLEALAPFQLPGQSTPLMVYTVLEGRGRRVPGWERWERVLSPFVGRERELALLHALLAQVETGRGQVAGVVGEPGIGKSRLLYEFHQSLEGKRLTYLTGRCLSYGSTTPYLPVLDILRHNCGITETDRPEDITAKVHRALQEVDMAPAEWAPVLLHLLGVQEEPDAFAALSPEARKARTLAAGLQMCLQGSRRQPLILEMEDLHWVDASSDECLTALVERMAGAAILVLVTYRPGYRPTWVDKSYVTQVALQPLTQPDSLRVVQAVLPPAAQTLPLVPLVLAKAEGNPFFLEELARAVVEQGADVSSLTVPDTVQAVLTARMDRLPTAAKRLLQVAAVIGKDVALPLLQAVTEASAEALHGALRSLQAAEFLYETYALTTPAHTFTHVLTQEVAYHSLVRHVRQHYHTRIAHVLETQFPQIVETQPAVLARHYTEAGLAAQAIPYWQRAGQQALEHWANREAVQHLTTALALLATLPDTPARAQQELAVQLALGPAMMATTGPGAPEVAQTYARARALGTQGGEAPQDLPTLWGLWRSSQSRGALPTARELAEQLVRAAARTGDPTHRVQAHDALGATLFQLGAYAAAWRQFVQALALCDPTTQRDQALHNVASPGVRCLVVGANALWCLGFPTQAAQRCQEALALAQELAHPYSLVVAQHFAAFLHCHRREVPAVRAQAETLLALATAQGFPLYAGYGHGWRGWARAMQGAGAAGLAEMHQGLTLVVAAGQELARPLWLVRLGEAVGHVGQVAEGRRLLVEALAAFAASGRGDLLAEAHRLQGELWLRQIPPDTAHADTCFQQALAIARQQQARSWELRAALSLSRLWQQQGQDAKARDLLAPIYGWFTEGFETVDLQEAQVLLEQLAE